MAYTAVEDENQCQGAVSHKGARGGEGEVTALHLRKWVMGTLLPRLLCEVTSGPESDLNPNS